MPHKVEAAPSGRASCRGCKKPIPKGTLRFAEEFANQFSEDGATSYRYWHLPCAATKLANELGPALAAYDGPVEDRAALDAAIAEHVRPVMPYAENAPNGRARCRGCDVAIAKGEVRIAFERTFDAPTGPQKGAAYTHAACLAKYLEREREQGQVAPEPEELLQQIEAHSQGKVSAEDLAKLRAGLSRPSAPSEPGP